MLFMFLPCSLFISPKSHLSFFELFLNVFFIYLFEYLLIFLGLIVVLKSKFVHNNM